MKRAYWIRWVALVLMLSLPAATSTKAKTKKASSKTDAEAVKKKTTVEKDQPGETKDKDKDDEPLFPKKEGENSNPGVEIHPDLMDFYMEIAEVVQLDPKGQKKLLDIQEKKNKALETFDARNDKRIVRIENAMDRTDKEKRREKLRSMLKEIEKKRENIQLQADNLALRALSPEQRVTWNAYELWAVISPELEFDSVELELTDEQVEKSKAVCGILAKKMGAKGRIAKNPKIKRMTIEQIGRKVLNRKQREAYTRQQRRKRLSEEGEGKTIHNRTRRGRRR